jgi:LmbE family N-acetylglucosaminyl deacetylase
MDKKNILILSPHTDDAELGCGGTITRLLEEGNNIYWVVFSTAEDSLPKEMPKNTLRKEFISVYKSLGVKDKNVEILKYRVRYLFEKRQQILEKLVEIRNKIKPNLVIGPSLNDVHQDHIVVATEMVRAFKSFSSIISYELPWNHLTFNVQMLIRLEKKYVDKKLKLLNYYESQFTKERNYFSEEFIYGLASARGIQANSHYAEAFEIIRWIE